jgi:hypothetical protein
MRSSAPNCCNFKSRRLARVPLVTSLIIIIVVVIVVVLYVYILFFCTIITIYEFYICYNSPFKNLFAAELRDQHVLVRPNGGDVWQEGVVRLYDAVFAVKRFVSFFGCWQDCKSLNIWHHNSHLCQSVKQILEQTEPPATNTTTATTTSVITTTSGVTTTPPTTTSTSTTQNLVNAYLPAFVAQWLAAPHIARIDDNDDERPDAIDVARHTDNDDEHFHQPPSSASAPKQQQLVAWLAGKRKMRDREALLQQLPTPIEAFERVDDDGDVSRAEIDLHAVLVRRAALDSRARLSNNNLKNNNNHNNNNVNKVNAINNNVFNEWSRALIVDVRSSRFEHCPPGEYGGALACNSNGGSMCESW